jgi:hypothetical protein
VLKELAAIQASEAVAGEVVVPPPSPRANSTLTLHPSGNELLVFGGEHFDGKKCRFYSDLFRYSIKRNEWRLVSAKRSPPPRSSHQAVAVSSGGGSVFLFGGEFSSPNQTQFYHYRDLWCLDLSTWTWEQVRRLLSPHFAQSRADLLEDGTLPQGWHIPSQAGSPPHGGPRLGRSHASTALRRCEPPPCPPPRACACQYPHSPPSIAMPPFVSRWPHHRHRRHQHHNTTAPALSPRPKVEAKNGPSARSGHRMVHCRDQLLVFGGFFDNLREVKYYNDAYVFDLNFYQWHRLPAEVGAPVPQPRSGCCLAADAQAAAVYLYGGYYKKKVVMQQFDSHKDKARCPRTLRTLRLPRLCVCPSITQPYTSLKPLQPFVFISHPPSPRLYLSPSPLQPYPLA